MTPLPPPASMPASLGSAEDVPLIRSWTSAGVASLTVDVPASRKRLSGVAGNGGGTKGASSLQPSRWKTPEHFVWFIVLGWGVYHMIAQGMALSRGEYPTFMSRPRAG